MSKSVFAKTATSPPLSVVVLPATRPLDGEDASSFAARVRAAMAAELGVPLSSYDAKSLNAEYVARRRPK